jgi:hypothetical protein
MRPGTLTCRTLVTLIYLMATAGTSHATIILGSLPSGASILQLPQQAAIGTTIAGTDPAIGAFTFTSGNLLGSDATTDQITGLLDFEDLTFRATNPGVIIGLAFQFDASLNQFQSAEVIARDQSGRSFLFTFSGPISSATTVSLLATGGETISGFSLSSPILAGPIGPFRVTTVPEPSTLGPGLVGGVLAGLGYAWRRRRTAA